MAPATKMASSCRLNSCSQDGEAAEPNRGSAAGMTRRVRNRTCSAVTQRDTAHPHRVNLLHRTWGSGSSVDKLLQEMKRRAHPTDMEVRCASAQCPRLSSSCEHIK